MQMAGFNYEGLGSAKANNDVHRLDHQSRKIPKPKGQAGQAPPRGYNVQEAMGLADDNDRYNSAKYLDLTKRIRAQDQIVLDLGLELIPHPFLQQFENVWPMRDMIGQLLRDSSEDGDDTEDKEEEEENDGDGIGLVPLAKFLSELSNQPTLNQQRTERHSALTLNCMSTYVDGGPKTVPTPSLKSHSITDIDLRQVEDPKEESQSASSKKRH
ncbi:hypothetical protein BD769DRAFT_1703334 [Suillus cothurnatus]|nr:hypothetical protein BD769DRAFT_1703334 [Suillus cothurnatus]